MKNGVGVMSEELINITDVENWLGQDYEYRALSTLVDLLNGSYPLEKFREDIKNYKIEECINPSSD